MKKNNPTSLGQKGLVHLSPLILIAAVGVIAFILLAASGDFKDSVFAKIFPKEVSEAARRIIHPWWRRWRPPPSPTPTPTPAPVPTSTPGPTAPPSTGTFPIGPGLGSSTNVDWWNTKALSSDLVLGSSGALKTLSSAKGVRVLFANPDNPVSGMDEAKANGWLVTTNVEDPDLNYVLSKEKEHYQMAKDRGLTFIFGPTGRMLEDDYADQDYALLRNADIMIYQTQRRQDYSGFSVSDYATYVKDLIGKIRPYLVKKQVWVQVSVNPPANRCTTAEKVIQYIDSIFDGSANSPDALNIFVSSEYDSQCSEKRVDVMKQVVDHYR
ncbi:hypothetical protein HYS94_05160 [Candidatus Daviesbacteria bacterium]|nr:hypothetical protein [Candidatus Daviesbacteria bacterium]